MCINSSTLSLYEGLQDAHIKRTFPRIPTQCSHFAE